MRVVRLVAGLFALTGCGIEVALAQPSVQRGSVPLTRLRVGPVAFSTYSGLVDSMRAVVRDSARWRLLWERLNQPFYPQPALPLIDFQREMVVVAALGAKSSGGYDLIIESAELDSSGIEVALRRENPAPGCPVAAVMTQPADLARIPASEQPVRFRERTVVVPCGGR